MRRPFVRGVLLAILAIAVIGAIFGGGFQTGYTQGLMAGGQGEIIRAVPAYGIVGFSIFGGIMKALFAVLIFGFFAKLLLLGGRRHWVAAGHPGPWKSDRAEEMKARMESHLSEWHAKAHDEES